MISGSYSALYINLREEIDCLYQEDKREEKISEHERTLEVEGRSHNIEGQTRERFRTRRNVREQRKHSVQEGAILRSQYLTEKTTVCGKNE